MTNRGFFQKNELAFELRHEDAALGYPNRYNSRWNDDTTYSSVYVDGKYWKTMKTYLAKKSAQTLRAKGKHVTWKVCNNV